MFSGLDWDAIGIALEGIHGTIAARRKQLRISGMTNLPASIWNLYRGGIVTVLTLFVVQIVDGAQFRIPDSVAANGELVQTEVRVSEFDAVQAFQFSLSWDPAELEVGAVSEFGLPGLGAANFGIFGDQGRLSVIWDSFTLQGENLAEDAVLFGLSFRVLAGDGATAAVTFGDAPTQRLVVQNLSRGEFESTPGQILVGLPPVISGGTAIAVSEDQTSDPLPLTFSDDSTPVEQLVVTFETSNSDLLPLDGIQLLGEGETRDLIVTPLPNQFGTVELVVKATDSNGGIGSLPLTVEVASVNDPPQAVDDALLILEDSEALVIEALQNDTLEPDPAGSLELVSVAPGSQGGSTEIVEGGILYRPAPNFSGIEEVVYEIRDEGGLSDNAIVLVTITPVNDPPTVVDDRIVIQEDSAELELALLGNDSAAPDEGETLSISDVGPTNLGGEVALREGRVFYTPQPDFFGVDSFAYTVSDGNGGVGEGTVNVEVQPVNDPPVAIDDRLSVPEDSTDVFIDVLGNDHGGADTGEVLSISSVEAPSSGGTVKIEDGVLLYSAPPNFFGIERFEYTIDDGNGATAVASVSVTVVNDRSDAPVARDDRFDVDEDSGATLLLVLEDNGNGRDFDPDGDRLEVVAAEQIGEFQGLVEVDASGQGVLYTPAANFVGSETFSYQISDGERTASGFVFVTVANANNDPPLAFLDEFLVDEDSTANRLEVLADNGHGADRDPEEEELTVALVPGIVPLGGTITLSDDERSILYTPHPDFSGLDEFPYFVSDGSNDARGLVRLEVVNQDDDPPLVRNDMIEVPEDATNHVLDVLGDNGEGADFDPEGLDLSIISVGSVDEQPLGDISIASNERGLFYSPPRNFVGDARFEYTVSDGLHEVSGEVTLRVVNIDDDPPVALDDSFVVDEGAVEAALPVLGDTSRGFDFDPEGESVRVVSVPELANRGGKLELGSFGRLIFYTPAKDFDGEESFAYVISDGGLEASGQVVITVNNVDDDPPVAVDDLIEVPEDSIQIPLLVLADNGKGPDLDPEGQPLRIERVNSVGAAGGTAVVGETGRSILYTPAPNFIGQESFEYTISDGLQESSGSVVLEVVNVDNDPPVAQDDQFLALEDEGIIELKVLEDNGAGPDFDPDGDALQVVAIPASTDGSVAIRLSEDGKAILYQSAPDFFGLDRFSYSVGDGTQTTEATVSVLVTRGDNDPPVAKADRFTVVEDSGENFFDLLADNGNGPDVDPDEDTLRLIAVHGPGSQGGEVRRDADSSRVVYQPAPDFAGEETFTYTISDGLLTSTGGVTVLVTPIPDPPRIESIEPVRIDQGTERVEVLLVVEDVDSPTDDLRVVVSSDDESLLPPEGISLTRGLEGWRLALQPEASAFGQVSLLIEASDGESVSRESFLLTIDEIVLIRGQASGVFVGNGTVFVDLDGDGLRSDHEPEGIIGRESHFEIRARRSDIDSNADGVLNEVDGNLVVSSGLDRLSGTALPYELRAPLGSTTISPFSTLVSAVLEVGRFQSLGGAVERARLLSRLGGGDVDGTTLLSWDPVELVDMDPGLAKTLLLRNASLDAVVNHLVRLFLIEESLTSTRGVFYALAELERSVIDDCAALDELIERMASNRESNLNSEVSAFAGRLLCQHLERIDSGTDLELPVLAGHLGQLRLFAEVDLWPDIDRVRQAGEVLDSVRFRALTPQADERVADFPRTNILDSMGGEGSLRFLRSRSAWFEDGERVEPAMIVREGGSRGVLNAAVLLVGVTATPGLDIGTQPLVLSFADGQLVTELDLSERLIDDSADELDEVVSMRLFFGDETDEQGNALVRDRADLSLRDDEGTGLLEFLSPSFVGDEDAAEKTVFVERRGGVSGVLTGTVRLLEEADGASAEEGVDYNSGEIRLAFGDGERVKGLALPVIADFQVEPNEQLSLDLSSSGSAASGGQTRSQYTIVNDDFDLIPTIEMIPDIDLEEDSETTVVLRLSDDATAVGDLNVEAISKNLSIVVVKSLMLNAVDSSYLLGIGTVPNATGQGKISVRVSDGRQTVEQEFNVTVTPVNDSPSVRLEGQPATAFVEDEAPVAVASAIVVEDVDGGELEGARVAIVDGFVAAQDRLIFGQGGAGISARYDRDTGAMELSGRASIADYQTALRSVLYDNRSNNPSTLSRLLQISVRDADVESPPVEAFIVVQAVNDEPILGRAETDPLVYPENAEPMTVSSSIIVATVDDQFFYEASVQITEGYVRSEDRLTLDAIPEGLVAESFDLETGKITISGEGTLLEYQNALRAVRYVNLSEAPQPANRTIEFSIRDEDLWSDPEHREIRVVPINDLPLVEGLADIFLVSGEQTTVAFTVNDPDSELSTPSVSVRSSNAALILAPAVRPVQEGVSYLLSFGARFGQVGEAEVSVSVGLGDNQVEETFRVSVSQETFAPRILGAEQISLVEDSEVQLLLRIEDPDDVALGLEVAFEIDNRALFPPGSVMVTRDLFDLTIRLAPAKDAFGKAVMTFTVSDGSESSEHQVEITVSSENDLPVVEGIRDFLVDPGAELDVELALSDVETPIDQLLLGIRPLDPRLNEQLSFEISGRGDRRNLRLGFDPGLRESVAFQLVVVDSDGGASEYPFTVEIRQSALRPESLNVVNLGNGQVEFRWEGGGRLAISSEAAGPYLPIPGSESPFRLRIQEGQEFFRLVD